jgi:hypothetical protein
MTESNRSPLPSPQSAEELLNHYYLHMRSALVETASGFDRIQRAQGGEDVMKEDSRIQDLQEASRILLSEEEGRTQRMLDALSVEDDA